MLEIKGKVLQDSLASIRSRVGQERLLQLCQSAGPEAQAFCAEPINVSSWYSLDAFASLLDADIRELDDGDSGPFSARAEKVFEEQLRGVYRLFIRVGSPESLIRKITAAHTTYCRGADIEVVTCARGRAVVRYGGFAIRHRVMEHAIASFYRKGLELSGAREVHVRFTTSIARGTGVAEIEMTWSI